MIEIGIIEARPAAELAAQRSGVVILTYRYRLLPSKRQHAALARLCEEQRVFYNAALGGANRLLPQDREVDWLHRPMQVADIVSASAARDGRIAGQVAALDALGFWLIQPVMPK